MIVLRTPKGWTGPKKVDGHKVEDFWRAHQVPIPDAKTNPKTSRNSKRGCAATSPKSSSTKTARSSLSCRNSRPTGDRRITANPHANGGLLRKPLDLPDFRDYAVDVERPRASATSRPPPRSPASCATS